MKHVTTEGLCPKNETKVYKYGGHYTMETPGDGIVAVPIADSLVQRTQGAHFWLSPNFVSVEYSYYCAYCLEKKS